MVTIAEGGSASCGSDEDYVTIGERVSGRITFEKGWFKPRLMYQIEILQKRTDWRIKGRRLTYRWVRARNGDLPMILAARDAKGWNGWNPNVFCTDDFNGEFTPVTAGTF